MKSLKSALTVRLLTGGLVLLGLAGFVLEWRMRSAVLGEFDNGLRLEGQSLKGFIELEDDRIKMDHEVDDLPQFAKRGGDSIFIVADAEGNEISRSPSLADETLVSLQSEQLPVFFKTRLSNGQSFRCLMTRLDAAADDEKDEHHGEASRPVLLTVGRTDDSLRHTLANLRQALLVAGVATLLPLCAFVWWGVRRGLSPLDQLVKDISSVDSSSLATRIADGHLPSELQPVVARLNELLDRLGRVFAREKRFTADVSHELRTPLAEMRTLAEVNLLVPPDTAAGHAAGWTEVQAAAVRMESLTVRLLELARTEQPGRALKPEPVEIAPLVDTIWKRHQAAARERNIRMEAAIPRDLIWHVDPVLLDLVLSNLLANASQHAPQDSTCRMKAGPHRLILANPAGDLDPAEATALFERFWKKDAARTDGRRHGLGLALARTAATLMGGTLEVAIADEVVFTLELPTPEAESPDAAPR